MKTFHNPRKDPGIGEMENKLDASHRGFVRSV